MRRRNVVAATAIGAVLALAVPGTAFANTMTSVVVVAPSASSGPTGPDNEKKTAADCDIGNGYHVAGGGVIVTGSGGTNNANNDIHVMGTEPGDGSGGELSSTTSNVAEWLGIGGTGSNSGDSSASYTTRPFAICFTSSSISGTEVVLSTDSSGPNGPNSMSTPVVATCPGGYTLIGGGARSNLTSNGTVKVVGSTPPSTI